MLVSPQQFFLGGDSRPRNEIIMKLFRLLGASERQGFGGPLIYKAAVQNEFREPEIITDINHTELKVWNIDLADSYPDLEERHLVRKVGNGPSAKHVVEIESVKLLTQLQMAMEILKKQVT